MPATPNMIDGENDAHDLRCFGKSITLMVRSKSYLYPYQPWLRSPSKRKVLPRTSEPLKDGKENTRNSILVKQPEKNNTLPTIVQKNKTPLRSSLMCCKNSTLGNQTTGNQPKEDNSEMRRTLPKVEGWSQRERLDIIIGKL